MWSSDWADSSFCAATYDQPYLGTTYNGVAACGQPYENENSNMQGPVYYGSVELDSYGFQCVELAARYFYYITGQTPPQGNGDEYAYNISAEYSNYNVYPPGYYGSTSTFESSITPGQIISMWSSAYPDGHVAVVTGVNVTNGNGTITVMDENASATGTDTITVSNGTMSYEGIYPDFQWTTNLPVPSSGPIGIVASNNDGQMGVQLENFPLGTSYYFCHAGSGYPTGGTIASKGSFDVTSADESWSSGICSGSGNYWIGIQATNGSSYYSNQVTLGSAPPGIVASNNDGQMGVQLENFPLGTSYYFCHAGSGYPTGGTIASKGSFDVTSAGESWSSGVCSGSGNYWIGIQATNGSSYYSNQVILGTPPTITTVKLPGGAQFKPYAASLHASGGTSYRWSVAAGKLPAGLKLTSGGSIKGSPTVAGHFSVTVKVTDSTPLSASATLSIAVARFSVESGVLHAGVVGKKYRAWLVARGGKVPLSWKITSGKLPPGLKLSRSGLISGAPSKKGSYTFTVEVTDAGGHSAKKKVKITIKG